MVLLAGCKGSWTIDQFDRVSRTTGARTIVHEADFSIYSPFDAVETRPYLEVLREQDRPLQSFFGLNPPDPWIVVLVPTEELGIRASGSGNSVQLSSVSLRRPSGVEGVAHDRTAYVYVAAPQEIHLGQERVITGYMAANTYATTTRHELVHLYATLAGLSGDLWFNEALAGLLEDAPLDEGRFRLDDVKATVARLSSVPEEQRDLRRALTLREDIGQLEAGQPYPFPPARALGRSFLQFLLLRSESNDHLAELRRIRASSLAQLLALEAEWRSWLARQQ